ISIQHIVNCLLQGICHKQHVVYLIKLFAIIFFQQNSVNRHYTAMTPNPDESLAFSAARALIFKAVEEAGGYTENTLHRYRNWAKQTQQPSQDALFIHLHTQIAG
ncbi:MAG: hypothetical protein AAFZ92_11010, partial [Pseudomonadota bacterium]